MPVTGFHLMSSEKRRECARRGALSLWKKKKAHQFKKGKEARDNGRKGGLKTAKMRREMWDKKLREQMEKDNAGAGYGSPPKSEDVDGIHPPVGS